MGLLIEKYIGKAGRKLFLGFCWLFTLIVMAAFADMVADTFNAYVVTDGVTALAENATVNGAAGSISLFFILFAAVFGLVQRKAKLAGWKEVVFGLACTVLAFVCGMNLPVILGKEMWVYIAFAYIFLAAVLPMWFLMQPRDYMSTFMFVGMIVGAVLGLIFAHPTMNLPAYTGFRNDSLGTLFPILFVTVACGAVSGFHSLVSSGTSSKTISNEKDMLKVGIWSDGIGKPSGGHRAVCGRSSSRSRWYGGSGNTVPDLLFRSGRIPGDVRDSGFCSPELYDHVRIRVGIYYAGLCGPYRPHVFPGIIQYG